MTSILIRIFITELILIVMMTVIVTATGPYEVSAHVWAKRILGIIAIITVFTLLTFVWTWRP